MASTSKANGTAPSARSEVQAAVLHGAKDLRIETRSLAAPGPGQCQIEVLATGCCGSDLHYYNHGRNGDFVVRDPMVLGHESGGRVLAVGEGVTHLQSGDMVAIEAGINCGRCRYCKTGRYNLCTSMRFASSAKVYPHQDGLLQTALNHPATHCHKIPSSVSVEQAALVEPLSVVLNAARRAGISAGQSVLVLGAGAVGVLACAVCSALGATYATIVDINAERVHFAVDERFATNGHVLPLGPRPSSSAESLEQARKTASDILEKCAPPKATKEDGEGYDVVFECTGVESCMQAAIHAARSGGKVVYIGMGTSSATLPISAAAFREVDIMGVFRYANTYEEAIELFAAGKLGGVEKLVTTRYPLSRAPEAFEALARGKDDDGRMIIKLVITAS